MSILEKVKKQIKQRNFEISPLDKDKEKEERVNVRVIDSYGDVEKEYNLYEIQAKIIRFSHQIMDLQDEVEAYKLIEMKTKEVLKNNKIKV